MNLPYNDWEGEKVIMSNRSKSYFFVEGGLGLGYFMLVQLEKKKQQWAHYEEKGFSPCCFLCLFHANFCCGENF